jgi:hypothetical protein
MRLLEITGNTEDEVYSKLRTTYTIFSTYLATSNRTVDFEELYNDYLEKLYEDKLNLEYWLLASDRISKLYSEIKKII